MVSFLSIGWYQYTMAYGAAVAGIAALAIFRVLIGRFLKFLL